MMAIQSQQELDFEKQLADYKGHAELQRLNLTAGFAYVGDATKSAFLLNGAAAIALMTYIGAQRSVEGPATSMAPALATFCVGAAMAVLTMGFAYLSQSFFALMNVRRAQRSGPGETLSVLGILLFFGSAGMFVVGVARTARVLSSGFSIWSAFGL